MRSTVFSILLLATLLIGAAGCLTPAPSPEVPDAERAIADTSYLTADLWNDGQAEVAFYRVQRTRDQYGNPNEQTFMVGTYLVKHRFSPEEMTKKTDGSGVPSFKYALFYELESGSYQYKRNWVVNARQEDLRPFKHSFTSFDWCSNQYREMAFPMDGAVEVRMRSDDYGNRRSDFAAQAHSYPPAHIPLLVRSLDFGRTDTLSFSVTTSEGTHVPATATLAGPDRVGVAADTAAAQRIVVAYDEPVPSPIAERTDERETYWRGTGADRRLLRVAGASGRYRMDLVEHRRSPYWQENLWTRLDRVDDRP
jgi:hypothetical protein